MCKRLQICCFLALAVQSIAVAIPQILQACYTSNTPMEFFEANDGCPLAYRDIGPRHGLPMILVDSLPALFKLR